LISQRVFNPRRRSKVVTQVRCTRGLGTILLSILSSHVGGQPVVEKPNVKLGDYWQFRLTATRADQNRDWSRKIVEITPDGNIKVQTESDSLMDYDSAMNILPLGRPEFARILARYPLQLGASWTYVKKFAEPYTLTEERGRAKVAAYESITVPAGTFSCFRVEGEGGWTYKTLVEQRQWIRWYCPMVKWMAKEILLVYVFNPSNGGPNTTISTSELTAFNVSE
jgi:hypothetical protein